MCVPSRCAAVRTAGRVGESSFEDDRSLPVDEDISLAPDMVLATEGALPSLDGRPSSVPRRVSEAVARRWCVLPLPPKVARHVVKRRRGTCITPTSGDSGSGGNDWVPPRSTNTLRNYISPRGGVVLPIGIH